MRRRILRGLLAVCALVAVCLVWLLRYGFVSPHMSPRHIPPPSRRSWQEVFAHPRPIRLESLSTGTATGDRRVVLDPKDPNLGKLADPHAPSVIQAHVLVHDELGTYVVDTGLADSFSSGEPNYSGLLQMFLSTYGVTTTQEPGQSLLAHAVSPREVFLTHLHGDHTSGLEDLSCDVPVTLGASELGFMSKALSGNHLECHQLQPIYFHKAISMDPFSHVLDVLGDGSLWAIATPGHSPGHISYLVNGAHPWLITGDAAAYFDQLRYEIRPAPGVDDADRAHESLAQLAAFTRRFPQVSVIAGHDLPVARE